MKSSRPTVKQADWLSRQPAMPLPFLGLCTSEEQFMATMTHLKITNPPRWLTGKAGCTHTFEHAKHGTMVIVCIDAPKGRLKGEIYGLLIHEAVHVWQIYCDEMNERKPSEEFQAYTIQAIAQNLLFSYDDAYLSRKIK